MKKVYLGRQVSRQEKDISNYTFISTKTYVVGTQKIASFEYMLYLPLNILLEMVGCFLD